MICLASSNSSAPKAPFNNAQSATTSFNGRSPKAESEHRQLTGRREAIEHVCTVIRSRASQAVYLMAGPGVGKTSVTDAVRERLAAEMTVLRIHGSSSLAKVPYGVLAPYTSGLAPEEADSPVAVLRAVWAHFQELKGSSGPKGGTDAPVLLVVDDAHHLDDATASMVVDMTSAGWATVLAAGRPRPGLPPALNQLWYDGLAERIDLRPLSGEQVREVVEHTLQGTVPVSTVQSLWSASGGNPLLLDCLLSDATAAGILVQRNGIWVLLGPLPADGPRLSDLVVKDLLRRPPEEQDALKVIALAEPVSRGLIEDVCGAGVVRSLLDNQVVSESAATHTELRLAHAILGESTRRQVSVSRSLQLRQKVDAHLDAAAASAEGRLRLVQWSLECGLEVPDRDLLDAGLLAAATFNNAGARLMAGHVRAPELQAQALSITARAHFNEGKYREAAELLDGCWLDVAADPVAPQVLMLRASSHLAMGKSVPLLRSESRHQLEAAGIDPAGAWQDRIHGLLEMAAAGDHEGIAGVMTSLGTPDPDTASAVEATQYVVAQALLAQALVAGGRSHQAHAAAAAAGPFLPALSGGLYFFNEFVLTRLALSTLAAGNWESAEHELSGYPAERTEGAATFGGGIQALRGLGLLRQGQLERAYQVLLPAVEALRVNDPLQEFRFGSSLAFYAAARLGDTAQAKRLEQDFISARHASGPGCDTVAEAYAAAAAEYLDRKGSGLDRLRELASSEPVADHPGTRMECLILCTDLGERSLARELASLAASVEGRWAAGWRQLAQAWASEDADILMETAGGLEEAGLLNLAREAYARAGALLDAAGERRRARQAIAHREKCDQELGERFRESPFVASVPSVHLTRRERDIVELAVQGLSDREIAQHLMVSVRTVEGHLYRSYVKLGVRRRDELALALPKK